MLPLIFHISVLGYKICFLSLDLRITGYWDQNMFHYYEPHISNTLVLNLLLGGIGSLSIQIIYILSLKYCLPDASCSLDSLLLPQGWLK